MRPTVADMKTISNKRSKAHAHKANGGKARSAHTAHRKVRRTAPDSTLTSVPARLPGLSAGRTSSSLDRRRLTALCVKLAAARNALSKGNGCRAASARAGEVGALAGEESDPLLDRLRLLVVDAALARVLRVREGPRVRAAPLGADCLLHHYGRGRPRSGAAFVAVVQGMSDLVVDEVTTVVGQIAAVRAGAALPTHVVDHGPGTVEARVDAAGVQRPAHPVDQVRACQCDPELGPTGTDAVQGDRAVGGPAAICLTGSPRLCARTHPGRPAGPAGPRC